MLRRLTLLLVIGCGSRSELASPTVAPTCGGPAPTCVVDGVGCARAELATATCDGEQWHCPANARPYARVEATSCAYPDARGSLVAIPTDDGRCMLMADDNTAFEVDRRAPFGSCPAGPSKSVVVNDDPSLTVQVTGGYTLGRSARITYRLFRNDPGAPFGLAEIGTGVARWRGDRIAIDAPQFATDLDLGDASIAIGDRAYVFGCPPPIEFLTEKCLVGRLDERDTMELFVGHNRWVASTRASDGERVFDAGPWVSAVVARPEGGFVHVYAVGFGTELETHVASSIEGPWEKSANLGRCELPAGDPHAFCAGPVVHEELADPTRPNELVISYGRGSTSPGAGEQHPVLARLSR